MCEQLAQSHVMCVHVASYHIHIYVQIVFIIYKRIINNRLEYLKSSTNCHLSSIT